MTSPLAVGVVTGAGSCGSGGGDGGAGSGTGCSGCATGSGAALDSLSDGGGTGIGMSTTSGLESMFSPFSLDVCE